MDVLILKFATQLIAPIWHHELELLHDMTRDTLHWTKTTEAITALVIVFVVLEERRGEIERRPTKWLNKRNIGRSAKCIPTLTPVRNRNRTNSLCSREYPNFDCTRIFRVPSVKQISHVSLNPIESEIVLVESIRPIHLPVSISSSHLSRMLRHGRKSSNESKSLLTAGMCLQMLPTTRRTCDVFLLLLETKSGRRLSVTNGVREEGSKR